MKASNTNILNLSFSEYYKSKEKLREYSEKNPLIHTLYEITKYPKLTVVESDGTDSDRIIKSFKPGEHIKILWDYEDIHFPTVKNIYIMSENKEWEKFYTRWSNRKLMRWTINNTIEVEHTTLKNENRGL